MRNERIIKCPPVSVQKMNKNESGSFDFRSDGNSEIVRCNDISVVTIGSRVYRVQPIRKGDKRRRDG